MKYLPFYTKMQWCETDKTLPKHFFFTFMSTYYWIVFNSNYSAILCCEIFFFFKKLFSFICFLTNYYYFYIVKKFRYFQPNDFTLFRIYKKKTVAFLFIYLYFIYLFTKNYRCWCNGIENFSIADIFFVNI